jgi:hypothetical protein
MRLLTFARFKESFLTKVSTYRLTWEAVGFHAPGGRVYPFGTDTKVISTVFEALAAPIISEVASDYGYLVEGSQQTVYPDFTLSPPSGKPPRIAVDVKTTYRRFNARGELLPFRYTLGSYTSFLRATRPSKNIRYPYEEYSGHWVIGFLYTRRLGTPAKAHCQSGDVKGLACPYQDVEFFLQEKYKIVGCSPGSGNTANIGSFPTNRIGDLDQGLGPFANLGKEVCDEYWASYGRRTEHRPYSTLAQFLAWRQQSGGHR